MALRPYFEDEQAGICLYLGDCLEVGALLPKDCADATIVDPPFMVRADRWDTFASEAAFLDFTTAWMKLAARATPLVAAFFADLYIPLLRQAGERAGLPYRRPLIWGKPPGSQYAGASLDGFWFDFEPILVFGEPRERQKEAKRFSILNHRTVVGQKHGCEKPFGLLLDLVDAYVPVGGRVLDLFSGTGTCLRAAKALGRRGIGVEKDERSCEVAASRLQQGVLQWDDLEPADRVRLAEPAPDASTWVQGSLGLDF